MLPAILAMALVVVASNVLVLFPVGAFLTWGAFTYPAAFLVVDVANRRLGAQGARRVVLWGFAVGVMCSLLGSQVMINGAPAVAPRVALASGVAFFAAQMLDVGIFDRLRRAAWWRAPLVSSLLSSALDTLLFFGIAFSAALNLLGAEAVAWAQGPAPLLGVGAPAPLWASLAVADLGVKVALTLAALLPFRLLTRSWGAA